MLLLATQNLDHQLAETWKETVSDNSPPGQLPHRIGIGPDDWINWLVVVLLESFPSRELP